jgi:hypothetical protein
LIGTYLNPRSKNVVRADRVHRDEAILLNSGDVFGIPVKNNNDQFYETCRFLVEELLDDENRRITKPPNSKILDDHAVAKIGDLEKRKYRNRPRNSEIQSIKRISNTESQKRIRPSAPIHHEKMESDDDYTDIDRLCTEIKFLRDANERFPFNRSDSLQRAKNEVQEARKQLSDWAFEADVPSEIAANIQKLV